MSGQDEAQMDGLLAMLDYDSESNTDHAQFRQYSSTEGRFLSPDPYGGSYDPANPQSFNRYEYAMDNPLSNIDPSGLDCQDGWYSADEEGDCFPGVPGYGGGGGAGAGGGRAQPFLAEASRADPIRWRGPRLSSRRRQSRRFG